MGGEVGGGGWWGKHIAIGHFRVTKMYRRRMAWERWLELVYTIGKQEGVEKQEKWLAMMDTNEMRNQV